MVKRMLIDASHAEETRVVVASGTRLEEFDYESATREQLKGNIYLAKVMRVEPSLQAAFVDYGGNRHGFLPFSEIHPDYYQIPVADREALFAEHEAAAAGENGADDTGADDSARDDSPLEEASADEDIAENVSAEAGSDGDEFGDPGESNDFNGSNGEEVDTEAAEAEAPQDGKGSDGGVETLGGGDEIEDVERRRLQVSRSLLSRRYKIQEVIKKRQIMLVQVVKEERGTKGAALTTYLSLAGRYCVLMPNAVRGGGISRKIVNTEDRRRLKSITARLEIPARMGLIVRTAGTKRSMSEIKRDLEYLLRQWENIRENTLQSTAPVLIYEEASLIKRSIRDLYTKDIDQIQVEGETGYRIAKDFMRTLIPSHSRKVQPYRDRIPLFTRFQVESQLDAMYSPEVQLKSGGYLVINATEALVAIDVNSGRSTRERNIEETALKTDLEAADEIARQLRLRDLAGLIVIDFIDMEEARNQRAVERRFKEAVRNDRARIQIGRISPFGLLELSRQRLRPSLVEASMDACPLCAGAGVVRSTSSSAVHVLRAVEEEGLRGRSAEIRVRVPAHVAVYILNHKRQTLADIEARSAFQVSFEEDASLMPPNFTIERVRAKTEGVAADDGIVTLGELPDEAADALDSTREGEAPKKSHRRRRKPKAERDVEAVEAKGTEIDEAEGLKEVEEEADADASPARSKRRRRGKRGGRRRSVRAKETAAVGGDETEGLDAAAEPADHPPAADAEAEAEPTVASGAGEAIGGSEDEAPKPRRRRPRRPARRSRAKKPEDAEVAHASDADAREDEDSAVASPRTGAIEQGQSEPEPATPLAAEPASSDVMEGAERDYQSAPQISVMPAEAPMSVGAQAEGPREDTDDDSAESASRRRGWWQRFGGRSAT